MQEQNYVSTTGIVCVSLWVAVTALIVTAWIVLAFAPNDKASGAFHLASMLAMTSGVLACAAVVSHIKMYALKVSNTVRVTSGLHQGPVGPSEDTVLHRVH